VAKDGPKPVTADAGNEMRKCENAISQALTWPLRWPESRWGPRSPTRWRSCTTRREPVPVVPSWSTPYVTPGI